MSLAMRSYRKSPIVFAVKAFKRILFLSREYAVSSRQNLIGLKFYVDKVLFYGAKGEKERGLKVSNSSVPVVKCFSQVRNEIDIIEEWILYHLHLFGEKNVIVLDDCSDDGTEKVLQRYSNRIVFRRLEEAESGTGRRRADNLTKIMRDHAHECDIMIPLDADEFIAWGKVSNKDLILKELRRLDLQNWGIYKFGNEYQSSTMCQCHGDPVREITRFRKVLKLYHMKKVFFSSDCFDSLGFGQHTGYTRNRNPLAYATAFTDPLQATRGSANKEEVRNQCQRLQL
jgi:hypothetical protein